MFLGVMDSNCNNCPDNGVRDEAPQEQGALMGNGHGNQENAHVLMPEKSDFSELTYAKSNLRLYLSLPAPEVPAAMVKPVTPPRRSTADVTTYEHYTILPAPALTVPERSPPPQQESDLFEEYITTSLDGEPLEAIDTLQSTDPKKMPFITVLLRKRLHILPIVTFIFIFASFILCYALAIIYGHVEPFFPYISACIFSHTGVKPPERSIFSMLINISAFLLGTNVYIRYKHMAGVLTILMSQHNHETQTRKPRKLNLASLIVGLLSAFGLSMVANFQTVDMRAWHYTGAAISFYMGSAYCWLQTAISLRFRPWAKVTVCQVINSFVLTVFLVMFTISKIIYRVRLARGDGTKWDSLRPEYLVSTITEWLTALAIVCYVLTFYHDFKNAQLHTPRVSIRDKDYVLKDYKLRGLPTQAPEPDTTPTGDSAV